MKNKDKIFTSIIGGKPYSPNVTQSYSLYFLFFDSTCQKQFIMEIPGQTIVEILEQYPCTLSRYLYRGFTFWFMCF